EGQHRGEPGSLHRRRHRYDGGCGPRHVLHHHLHRVGGGCRGGCEDRLTAVVVAGLFLLAMFFAPLAGVIPGVATAPVLIVIGAMMITSVTKIDWTDYRVSIPSFLAVVGMPFTYSITDGIGLAIVAHVLINAISGKPRDVHPVMYVLAILLIWRFFVVG